MAKTSDANSLQIDPSTALLVGVRQVLSPHCDDRPVGTIIDLVVVHSISLPPNEFSGPWIDRLFTGSLPTDTHPYFATLAGLRVSAHALIRRDGEIVQYVPFTARAWHAGRSSWQARENCNDFSVGIELEGAETTPFTDAQYLSLSAVLGALFAAYPGLSRAAVVGHSDVAPGRKTDPGPSFDWQRVRVT